MANQSNQGGSGLATPPCQIVPAVASAEDVTRYKRLATDVLRATTEQSLLERYATAVEGDAAALDQVWKEFEPECRLVAEEIKARDPLLADRVDVHQPVSHRSNLFKFKPFDIHISLRTILK